ncbi:MAG: Ig-like domain-containing protein [Lachnospiraceae bacterium]|nr:Ig-like domain-containing protein [Lachnospiraceae bacterium]
MVKIIKKILCVILTLVLLLTNTNFFIFAEQVNENSEIIPKGMLLNYRDMGENISKSFADEKSELLPVRGTLPSSYSASANIPESIVVEQIEDHTSPVKSQSPYGTCWAHAAMSMAESSYMINKKTASDALDLNEYHLVHYAYSAAGDSLDLFGGDYLSNPTGTSILEQGGHNSISLCVLANWQGASGASQSTYGDTQINNGQTPESILGYDDAAHMQNAYVIAMPDMSTSTYSADMNVVKQMVNNYGSVGISYYATSDSEYFLSCYQYVDDDSLGTNHGVTIVGWNDNISKTSFAKDAPGDGAWLVKNSWGSSWGAGGYFWLSYYDETIAEEAYVFDFVEGDNYDNNYQYDGSGYLYGDVSGSCAGQICGANAFVADSNETLEAVGFYTTDLNVEYDISIYRNLEEKALPNTGILVYSQSGKVEYIGYHTVKLNEKVHVSEGERYAVVITLKKSGEYVGLAVDESQSYSWVEFHSYAKSGESYAGNSIDTLQDLNPTNTSYASGRNARIKAFTNERTTAIEDVKANSIELNKTSITLTDGESMQLYASISPVNVTDLNVDWNTDNSLVATVDSKGKVTATGVGTAVITATTRDGSDLSASCSVKVNPIPAQSIEITEDGNSIAVRDIYGTGKTFDLDVDIYPENTSIKEVIWTSDNTEVATVNEAGVVTTVGIGYAFITATTKDGSNLSDDCCVFVSPILAENIEIVLNENSVSQLETDIIGKKYDLDVNILPIDATYKDVLWESSNVNVAVADDNGVVTVIGTGSTIITARTYDGSCLTTSCSIVVNKKDTDDNNNKNEEENDTGNNTNNDNDNDDDKKTEKPSVPDVTYISAPKTLKTTNISAGIQLNWNKVSGATGYIIYRKNNGKGSWKKIATIKGGSKITYTDKAIKKNNGIVYKYRVRAVKGITLSTNGKDATIVRLSTCSLKSVKKSGKTAIKCSWKKNSKVTGYRIRLIIRNKVYKTYTIKSSKTTSKLIKKLTKRKTYKVQIQSYKKVKGVGTFYSQWSGKKTVKL